jgi:hypothetical protein
MSALSLPFMDSLPPDHERSAKAFLDYFETVFETENRSEMYRMIADKYGGFPVGRSTLMGQIDKVLRQYEVLELSLTVERIIPFRDEVTVRTRWNLEWKCHSSDPDRGCPELGERENFPVKHREGLTTFVLEWTGSDWRIDDQRGNVLLGLFEPGRSVKTIK